MITGGLPASRLGFEPSTRRFDSYTVNQMSRPVFAFGKNACFVLSDHYFILSDLTGVHRALRALCGPTLRNAPSHI
jgi:hypothetical protein